MMTSFSIFQYLNTETSLIFRFASVVDFTESPPKATMRPPLQLVIKTEDRSPFDGLLPKTSPVKGTSMRLRLLLQLTLLERI